MLVEEISRDFSLFLQGMVVPQRIVIIESIVYDYMSKFPLMSNVYSSSNE